MNLKLELTQEELAYISKCMKVHRESCTHPDDKTNAAKLMLSVCLKISNATKEAYRR